MNKDEMIDKRRKLHEIKDQIKGLKELRKEAWAKCVVLINEYKGIKAVLKLAKAEAKTNFKPASVLHAEETTAKPMTPNF